MGKLNESFEDHIVDPVPETIFDLPDEPPPARTLELARDTIFDLPRETLSGTMRKPVPEAKVDPPRETPPATTLKPIPDTTLKLPRQPMPQRTGEQIPDTLYNFPREALSESTSDPSVEEASSRTGNTFFVWLQRSLAVGSILAMIAFVFLSAMSAIRMVIEPATETDISNGSPAARLQVTTNEQPEVTNSVAESQSTTNEPPTDQLTPADGPFNFAEPAPPIPAPVKVVRTKAKSKRVTKRVRVAAYETSRPTRPAPQPLTPLFFPTTLIIYVENGVIKTRTEPWLLTTSKTKTN